MMDQRWSCAGEHAKPIAPWLANAVSIPALVPLERAGQMQQGYPEAHLSPVAFLTTLPHSDPAWTMRGSAGRERCHAISLFASSMGWTEPSTTRQPAWHHHMGPVVC